MRPIRRSARNDRTKHVIKYMNAIQQTAARNGLSSLCVVIVFVFVARSRCPIAHTNRNDKCFMFNGAGGLTIRIRKWNSWNAVLCLVGRQSQQPDDKSDATKSGIENQNKWFAKASSRQWFPEEIDRCFQQYLIFFDFRLSIWGASPPSHTRFHLNFTFHNQFW